MLRLVFVFLALALPLTVFAEDDVQCAHHHGAIQCKFKQSMVLVGATINGGECPVPSFKKAVADGSKFIIPGSKECYYARSLVIWTEDGRVYRFVAM